MSDRLDEGKIELLRAWGAGLRADGNHDLRATGKAILLLIEEIERVLSALAERELVVRLPRRAGQKEERWEQLFGSEAPAASMPAGDGMLSSPDDDGDDRLVALEQAVADLREEVATLRAELEQRRT